MPTSTSSHLMPVYSQMPVRPVSGHGSWLVDEDGNEWLDAYGGHAVAVTGHSHPAVVRAIADQAARLLFYSTAVPLPLRRELAAELTSRAPAPLDQAFFCNSGAEANENALNLARRFTGRQTIVTVTGGWHGRTAATLACCDGAKYEEGARRAGVALSRRATFNDPSAIADAVDETVAAVLVEPVQGMAGARACTPEFLLAAREACDRAGAALIFDEIQCGTGRCGAFTAAESFGVVPDMITMAKGLASGLPMAAVLAAPGITATLKPGDLGSTFGGGPVPCAAALATLEVIDREGLIANAVSVGEVLREGARSLGIPAVDGRGLLLGLRLGRPAAPVQQALFTHRILTGTATAPDVLRLLPPLSFSHPEAERLLSALKEVLE